MGASSSTTRILLRLSKVMFLFWDPDCHVGADTQLALHIDVSPVQTDDLGSDCEPQTAAHLGGDLLIAGTVKFFEDVGEILLGDPIPCVNYLKGCRVVLIGNGKGDLAV